jgi:hypothetical protein
MALNEVREQQPSARMPDVDELASKSKLPAEPSTAQEIEKIADRPPKLTLAVAIISFVLSGAALFISWQSLRFNRLTFLLTQRPIVVRTLTVERIPNATGTTIVFSNHYQNSSILSVNELVAKAHVVIEDKDGYGLNESVSAPAFSAMLMGREERGFSVVVRPTNEELDSADRGDLPIIIDGDVTSSVFKFMLTSSAVS